MKNILLNLAIFAGLLISTANTQAQISTVQEDDGFIWIVVDGTEGDDSVYVVENLGGTSIYLYDENGLVDSMYLINFDPLFDNQAEDGISLFGTPNKPEYAVFAKLKGGDDFYYNNSNRFEGDIVICGTGSDTVYASPRESWVSSDYWDEGRKEIFGSDGDDWLMGGAGHDLIKGGNGDDLISGNDGNDALYGDAGDDDIDGGSGFNWMFGGTGDDTYRADDPANIIYEVAE